MSPHTRAIVAAATYAVMTGQKVAGVHDHATGRDLAIAAEARGATVQGFDGDRAVAFGGTLPELYDADDKAFVSLDIDGATARGYDRSAACHYSLTVTGKIVQLYDYSQSVWLAFSIQTIA